MAEKIKSYADACLEDNKSKRRHEKYCYLLSALFFIVVFIAYVIAINL